MSVGKLREWIDEPKPMGLPKEAQNLVILTFAAQTSRTFYLHGGPYDVTLANIPDNCELKTVDLPEEAEWQTAVQRAGNILGVVGSPLRSAGNVGTLTNAARKKAEDTRRACQVYCQRLRERMKQLGIAAETADRMRTASATQLLLDRLAVAEGRPVVGVLATAGIATSETAMGDCVGKAAELEGNLDTVAWDVFDAVGNLTDGRQAEAQQILAQVREALTSDEHAVPLAPALKGAQARAVRLLAKTQEAPASPVAVVAPPAQPAANPGKRIVGQGAKQDLTLAAATDAINELNSKTKPGQTVRVNLNWIVEEGGSA
jgi:hypothetical protein